MLLQRTRSSLTLAGRLSTFFSQEAPGPSQEARCGCRRGEDHRGDAQASLPAAAKPDVPRGGVVGGRQSGHCLRFDSGRIVVPQAADLTGRKCLQKFGIEFWVFISCTDVRTERSMRKGAIRVSG